MLPPQALITMALDIEERAGLEKAAIHSSAVKNTILRYRKMSVADWAKERKVELDREKARIEAAGGKPPPKENKPIVTGLPRDLEIVLLSKLHTPAPSEHGFVNAIVSEGAVNKAKSGVEAAQGWEQCDRMCLALPPPLRDLMLTRGRLPNSISSLSRTTWVRRCLVWWWLMHLPFWESILS